WAASGWGSLAEPPPGAGAGLSGVGLIDVDEIAWIAVQREVVQDRAEVGLVEPAGRGGQPQRLIDLGRAEDGGELDRAGHLGPHPGGAGRGGLDEPRLRAVADVEEVRLGLGTRPGPRRAGM